MPSFTPIRLLHLTDLHFRGAVPGTSEIAIRRSRLVPLLLDRIEAMLPSLSVDFVAVTGDLLHAPYGLFRGANPFAMEALRPAVAEDYLALKARFDRWGIPYLALPGNHDDEESFAAVFGGRREADVGGYRIVAFHDREGADNVPFRNGEERLRFHAVLGDGDPRRQIHLQHYVAHPEVDHPYPHNYGDAPALLEALDRSGRVHLSLCGHYHPGSDMLRQGASVHAVGRALCEAPHPVRVVSIGADGAVSASEVTLDGGPTAPARALVVSRDRLLSPAAHFRDPGGIVAADDLAGLGEAADGALLVCAASLDRDDLAGLTWPELADAHDRVHLVLARHGIALDAVYYTTRHPAGSPEAARMPRVTLFHGQTLLERVAADFGLPAAAIATFGEGTA